MLWSEINYTCIPVPYLVFDEMIDWMINIYTCHMVQWKQNVETYTYTKRMIYSSTFIFLIYTTQKS